MDSFFIVLKEIVRIYHAIFFHGNKEINFLTKQQQVLNFFYFLYTTNTLPEKPTITFMESKEVFTQGTSPSVCKWNISNLQIQK